MHILKSGNWTICSKFKSIDNIPCVVHTRVCGNCDVVGR